MMLAVCLSAGPTQMCGPLLVVHGKPGKRWLLCQLTQAVPCMGCPPHAPFDPLCCRIPPPDPEPTHILDPLCSLEQPLGFDPHH